MPNQDRERTPWPGRSCVSSSGRAGRRPSEPPIRRAKWTSTLSPTRTSDGSRRSPRRRGPSPSPSSASPPRRSSGGPVPTRSPSSDTRADRRSRQGGRRGARAARARAASLYSRCVALEPGDPALLADLHRAQLRAGETAGARATEQLALSHPKLSEPLRATLLTGSGDAAWAVSDVAAARERFTAALGLVQPEPAERALRARLWALADSRRGKVLRRLLAEADAGPETVLGLKELAGAEPVEGLPPYLLAKQLQNRGAWEGCLRYATAALSRRLPHPLFVEEALRMEGIAAWHLGDAARGRSAFAELGKGARPGRALEAKRWLDLF